MANPQRENSYTAIANEIMEALAGIRIPGEVRQCLDVILRKTYGWNKKEDYISLSQFALITHLGKAHICRSLLTLAKMNIIIAKSGNKNTTLYRFNKDFEQWKPLPKRVIIAKSGKAIAKVGNTSLPNRGHTITTTTIPTNTITPSADAQNQINEIIKLFECVNPAYTTLYPIKTERKAVEKLISLTGFEELKKFIPNLPQIINQPYAPKITTPYQLLKDMGKLKAFIAQEQQKSTKHQITNKNFARLHDGTLVERRFGRWIDPLNPNVTLDPHFYPEIANDTVQTSDKITPIKPVDK